MMIARYIGGPLDGTQSNWCFFPTKIYKQIAGITHCYYPKSDGIGGIRLYEHGGVIIEDEVTEISGEMNTGYLHTLLGDGFYLSVERLKNGAFCARVSRTSPDVRYAMNSGTSIEEAISNLESGLTNEIVQELLGE